MRYAFLVDIRTGRVVEGAIVLDDAQDLEEGALVTVWVEHSHDPVRLSAVELDLVRQGQAEAERSEGVDARGALDRLYV